MKNFIFSPANRPPAERTSTQTRTSDADAEHELEESTAEADRFVSEEAVLRLAIGNGPGWTDGGGGGGSGGNAGDGGGDKEGAAATGAKGKGEGVDGLDGEPGGVVPKLDEDHLGKVLEQV